jgi:hypothetical protein
MATFVDTYDGGVPVARSRFSHSFEHNPRKAQLLVDDSGIAIPLKARMRLGIDGPPSPVSSTLSEVSCRSMKFALVAPLVRRKPVPPLAIGPTFASFPASAPVYTSTPPLPPSFQLSPSSFSQHISSSPRTSTNSLPSILRHPPPARILRHHRIRSLDSLRRVRIVDPQDSKYRVLERTKAHRPMGMGAGHPRKSRSLGNLRELSRPLSVVYESTHSHLASVSSSVPATPHKLLPSPPVINVISPSPIKNTKPVPPPAGLRTSLSSEFLTPPDCVSGSVEEDKNKPDSALPSPSHSFTSEKSLANTQPLVFPRLLLKDVQPEGVRCSAFSSKIVSTSTTSEATYENTRKQRKHRRSYLATQNADEEAEVCVRQLSQESLIARSDSYRRRDQVGSTPAKSRRSSNMSLSGRFSSSDSARSARSHSRPPSFAFIDEHSESAWLATRIDGSVDVGLARNRSRGSIPPGVPRGSNGDSSSDSSADVVLAVFGDLFSFWDKESQNTSYVLLASDPVGVCADVNLSCSQAKYKRAVEYSRS